MPTPDDDALRQVHAQVAAEHPSWPALPAMLASPFGRAILLAHWRALKAAAHARQQRQAPAPQRYVQRRNIAPFLDQKRKAAGERDDD